MRFKSILVLGVSSLFLSACGVEWGLDQRHFGYERPGVLSWEEAKALEAKRPVQVKTAKNAAPEYNAAPTSSGGQKLEASLLRYNSVKAN